MKKRRSLIALAGAILLGVVLMGFVGAGFFVRARLRASQPALRGSRPLSGLSAPVRVERDRLGVPRIASRTAGDGFRALGFLHAQERFFQMDLMRRQAAGELAALVGAAALDADREARLHRMRARTERTAAALPPAARRALETYRDGVNAGLSALGAAPFEYLLLGEEPAGWRTSDSLLVVAAMAFLLNDAAGLREARILALEQTLPAELVRFLNPPGTESDAPLVGEAFPTPEIPGPGAFRRAGFERASAITPSASPSLRPGAPPPASGSNSWAVAAERTAGRAPLVASDMHLPLAVPNIWYRAELRFGGTRLAGLTLPGIPAVIAGSNGRVAWGFTNSAGDGTDLVALETDPAEPLRYRTPEGFRRMEVFAERLLVSGGAPETLEVQETIWGPVTRRWGRPYAIRWTAHDPAGRRVGWLDFAEAESIEELFRAGWESGMPPQNLVAADRSGAIGWTIAGPLPRRRGFDGRIPTSWADGERGWDGFLEPDEMPAIRNPPSGLLWTANNRIVDGEWLGRIGSGGSYAHGARARQIRDRLLGVEAADEPAMLSVQRDDRAVELEVWRKLFLEALRGSGEARAGEAARVLRQGWTGRASVESAAYPLVRNARLELFRSVYGALTRPASELLPEFSPWVANQWPGPLLRLAREQPAHFIPPGAADWREALERAVLDAALRLAADGPLEGRSWGGENLVSIRHPLSPALPRLLSRWLDAPPRGLPGDAGLPLAQNGAHGPSNRFVVAPGAEHRGILHMPGGQSGHPGSPYYLAGHRDWEEGRPTPFLAGPAAWTLTLTPGFIPALEQPVDEVTRPKVGDAQSSRWGPG